MGWLGDEPVTAISVVRHSDTFGFLGFYLCHPDHRGEGYGWQTWQAGIAHLGNRTVGLDGVPAQEKNYERSGFQLAHHTKRYAGSIEGKQHPDCLPAVPDDRLTLLELDRKISGADRNAYLSNWCSPSETRHSLVCKTDGRLTAFGTIRTCLDGHKIGPLFAPDATTARQLMQTLVAHVGATAIMIDIPDPNAAGVELATALDLHPVFSCARMYSGEAPVRQTDMIFGEFSFELG